MTHSDKTTPETTVIFHPRMKRELKTAKAMIALYCHAHHRTVTELCDECFELSAYLSKRLAHCPFQENKETCATCSVHCYKPQMRNKIIEVMRFAGPRMMLHHPFLALAHLLDEKLPRHTSKKI